MIDNLRELYGEQCLDTGRFGYNTRISAVNPTMIDDLGDQVQAFLGADILQGSLVSFLKLLLRNPSGMLYFLILGNDLNLSLKKLTVSRRTLVQN